MKKSLAGSNAQNYGWKFLTRRLNTNPIENFFSDNPVPFKHFALQFLLKRFLIMTIYYYTLPEDVDALACDYNETLSSLTYCHAPLTKYKYNRIDGR